MAKVIFEFDEDEDRDTINYIVNRHKILSALDDLQAYRRKVYKDYHAEKIVVKDNEVVIDQQGNKIKEYTIDGARQYTWDEEILRELDNILDNVYPLLD